MKRKENKQAPELVNLGLPSGTLWMKCNLGAEKETDFGRYYQFGDTEGSPVKTNKKGDITSEKKFTWAECPFNNGKKSFNETYFNEHKDELLVNGILKPEYDAVTAAYGAGYRMPTKADIEELLTLENEWVTDYEGNGENGLLFTGTNGNKLFIPAAGYCYDGMRLDVGDGGYFWSSKINSDGAHCAWHLYFNDGGDYVNSRYVGYSLRGVSTKERES